MNKLRQFRLEKGLTLKEVAQHLGVSEPTVSNYETGARHPRHEVLVSLAQYYGVSVDMLLGQGTDEIDLDEEAWTYREQIKQDPLRRDLYKAVSEVDEKDVPVAVALLNALKENGRR